MSRMLGRSKKEFKSLLCRVVIEMQILLNRCELSLVCWSPSRGACIVGMLLGWKCSEVQNLDTMVVSVTVRKRKRCFYSLCKFANNIVKQSIIKIRVFILYESMTIENSLQELTTFSYAGSFSGHRFFSSVVWIVGLVRANNEEMNRGSFSFCMRCA
jgi:hypothetical protein